MKRKIIKGLSAIVLILIGISFLYPLLWMILLSLKEKTEVYRNPFGLPEVWQFGNYIKTVKAYDFARYFFNSIIYSFGTIALTLICASMFAYAVARMRWKLRQLFLNYILMGLAIPGGITILALYIMLAKTGLKDTYQGLILVYSAGSLPLTITIIYGFMKSLPYELEESACMDGAGIFTILYKIILPMIKPAISTAIIIVFMNSWNEFNIAFITIADKKMMTLPIGLLQFINTFTVDWGLMGASMVLTSIPTVLLYLIFSNQIENALTVGSAVK